MATPNPTNGKMTAKEARKIIQTMMEDRALRIKGKIKENSLPDDAEFAAEYPLLWQYVTATQVGQFMEKDSARISFSIEESTWVVTLNDQALKQSMGAAGITFRAALAALEALLAGGKPPWVHWRKRGQEALREVKEEKKVLDV